jgi:hypothetical protein
LKNKKQPDEKRQIFLKNGNPQCDLWSLPRCQATAKHTGKRCKNIAIKGKRVCYLHGGRSPGASKGNRHALKSGFYTAEAISIRQEIRKLIGDSKKVLREIDA